MAIQTDPNSNIGLTEEQAATFATRLEIAVRQQPEVAVLNDILLAIGGRAICVSCQPTPEIRLLLNVGYLMSDVVKQRCMDRLGSHENVAKLWLEKTLKVTGIGTGLALNENGIWVWHEWGVTSDNIIETTSGLPLLKYFGRVLEGEEADRFAQINAKRPRSRLGKQTSSTR